MTEKIVDVPSLTSPDPGDGSIGQNSTFFQNNINTNKQQRHLYRDNVQARIQDFFVRSGGGGRRSRLLNLFYSLQRGSNGYITHFTGGSNFFQGGGGRIANFYRNPYNYNL